MLVAHIAKNEKYRGKINQAVETIMIKYVSLGAVRMKRPLVD